MGEGLADELPELDDGLIVDCELVGGLESELPSAVGVTP